MPATSEGSGFRCKFRAPVGAQDFHLGFQIGHVRGDPFVLFRDPGDGSIDHAPMERILTTNGHESTRIG